MEKPENHMEIPAHLTATDMDRAFPGTDADSALEPLTCNDVDCYISTNEFDTSPHPVGDTDEIINPQNP